MATRIKLAGFTKIELIVVVAACSLLWVCALLSTNSRSAQRAPRIQCVNNLKQIGLSYKTWALDHGDKFPMEVYRERLQSSKGFAISEFFQTFSNELTTPKLLVCPADTRVPAANFDGNFSNSNLSYFLSIDAQDTNPQMFLSGDRNLTNGPLSPDHILVLNTNYPIGWTREMHRWQGNIGLADGSVQQYSTSRLAEAARNDSSANRLAFP